MRVFMTEVQGARRAWHPSLPKARERAGMFRCLVDIRRVDVRDPEALARLLNCAEEDAPTDASVHVERYEEGRRMVWDATEHIWRERRAR